MKARTPTSTQLEALRQAYAHEGRLERRDGGFWTYPDCPVARILRTGPGEYDVPAWHCGTTTVYAMEKAGWLQRVHLHVEEWLDDRELTEAGRALVAPADAPPAPAREPLPLDTRLEDLDFPDCGSSGSKVRALNCCWNYRIGTIGEALAWGEARLLRVKNMGPRSVRALVQALAAAGHALPAGDGTCAGPNDIAPPWTALADNALAAALRAQVAAGAAVPDWHTCARAVGRSPHACHARAVHLQLVIMGAPGVRDTPIPRLADPGPWHGPSLYGPDPVPVPEDPMAQVRALAESWLPSSAFVCDFSIDVAIAQAKEQERQACGAAILAILDRAGGGHGPG